MVAILADFVLLADGKEERRKARYLESRVQFVGSTGAVSNTGLVEIVRMREKLIVSKVPNNSFVRFLRGFLKLGFLENGKKSYSQNRSKNTTKNQDCIVQSKHNIEHYFQFPTTEYEP